MTAATRSTAPHYTVQTAGNEITAEEIGDGFDDLVAATECARANHAVVVDDTGAAVAGTNFTGTAFGDCDTCARCRQPVTSHRHTSHCTFGSRQRCQLMSEFCGDAGVH